MLYILLVLRTMRHTWGRIKWGNNEDQARLWHLLYEVLTETPMAQPIVSSYPLPMSMLSSGGIDRNRNCILHSYFLWFCTFSTLYSSSSLIISSSSTESICCSLKCGSLHHVNRSLLNMLWITHSSGNSSWNTSWPMSFEILKGLYLLWSSFFEGWFEWILFASNYMLSSSFNPCKFCLFLSNYFFIAFLLFLLISYTKSTCSEDTFS